MDKAIHDKFVELFPKSQYAVNWGIQVEAPEWGSMSDRIFKREIDIIHLESDREALAAKAKELEAESEKQEGLFRFYEDDPRLDFDPGSNVESLKLTIFYC